MRKILFTGLICFLLFSSVYAQKSKPWSEWSKKDADKMLNDSAWAQTQIKGEAPPSSSIGINEGRSTQAPSSEIKLSTEIKIRVRFITAKPIREAFASKTLLSQPNPPKEMVDQLQAVIDRDLGDYIVVAVNVDGQDPRIVGGVLQALGKMTTAVLNQKVFLERKDGKRLPLIEYRPPIADNMGGKFVFARTLDGQPFLSADSDSVRFVLEMPGNLKLNVKFKVSNMMYGGELEY